MKTHLITLLLLMSVTYPLIAQRHATFNSSRLYDQYKLQGPVKTWTMTGQDGFIRQQRYDRAGNLLKDSCIYALFQSSPPDEEVQNLRADLEKTISHHEKHEDTNTWVFNERGQLLSLKSPTLHATSVYTSDGKILMHKNTQIITQTRAWNSIHHEEPTYTFTDTIHFLVVFKYNDAGFLKECEYFHTDHSLNFRWEYRYNENNVLLEMNRYDYINIRLPNENPDHYLDPLMEADFDPSFDINSFHKGFWTAGQPYTERFVYNEAGKKTETTTYGGYLHELGSRATWEYDSAGNPTQEIHYDVYRNIVQSVLIFDTYGNVIRETRYNTLSEIAWEFNFEIEYY